MTRDPSQVIGASAPGEEEALVARACGGDTAAFGLLYQRYVDRVYSYLRFRVRDPALTEDLTQEVFIQVMRGLATLEWRGSLAPWILRIARNTVVDHWRRSGRRPERTLTAVEAGEMDEDDNRMDRLLAQEEPGLELAELWLDRARIEAASRHLTDLQQQVLALRFAADLSVRETAEAMGRSEGAVKNLQHHAVRSLREQLGLGPGAGDAGHG